MNGLSLVSAAFVGACLPLIAVSAEPPKAPVPKSPFISVVYRYADAMLDNGRDTVGPQKTGLFLSALDRTTLSPLDRRPPAPSGLRESERAGVVASGALTGANPQHDENLLRLLYLLTELTTKTKYREAADAELKCFLEKATAPATRIVPWGRFGSWDVVKDEAISSDDGASAGSGEFFRPWMLWDRCFEIAAESSKQVALRFFGWEDQSPKHEHALEGMPRQAGFMIRTWSVAYAQTKDPQYLGIIETVLGRIEKKRHPRTGLLEGPGDRSAVASTLSLAIDCDGASRRVPEPLAGRLRAVATKEDEIFCALPHDLKSTRGFIADCEASTRVFKGKPTPLWLAANGAGTTARVGMMCVSRYENTGRVAYRELIHAAADCYLDALPGEADDLWAGTIGHAISLELAAWRSTAKPIYFECARQLGEFALAKFFDSGPLPRASLKSEHYETVTGADTLALAL
ncbi:MAG TPA: hypothetical protein VFV83_01005, partial [Chthoniobacteraceae bacterium]|nr:hypothetical protein [Chthoniobacteraceae bacterium]